jgi:hypothetical protein
VTQWQWIALAVYVVGFFLTLYVVGRLTRDQGAGGVGLVAQALGELDRAEHDKGEPKP